MLTIGTMAAIERNGNQLSVVLRYNEEGRVVTRDALKSLITPPTLKDAVHEATLMRQRTKMRAADAMKRAFRNLFRSPDRGLIGIPKEILESVIDETIALYRYRDATERLIQDKTVHIPFDAMQHMQRDGADELNLSRGASLLRLATVPGMKEFGVFGYYDPSKSILLLIPATITRRVEDTLESHRSSRSAPAAERPHVERTARDRRRR